MLALALDQETARHRLLTDGRAFLDDANLATADRGELAVHLPGATVS